MNFAPAGKQLSFDVTYDSPGLPVAMSVYDITGSPILVSGPDAMTNVVGNTYTGKFTGDDAKEYLIYKAVYTDGTFTTLSSDYSQSSETVRSDDFAGFFLNALAASYDTPSTVGAILNAINNIIPLLNSIVVPPLITGVVSDSDILAIVMDNAVIIAEVQ